MTGQRGEQPLTVLFTDVEGSTSLRDRLGDRRADELLGAHETIVRTHIARHRGREIHFLGDGFLIVFDRATDAVRCAVAIQRALEERNRAPAGGPLAQPRGGGLDGDRLLVRMGLHHGPVTLRDDNLYGQAVHAAARITAAAVGGQILASVAVKELAADDSPAWVDRGEFWLKGFTRRWRLYEAPWDDRDEATPAPAPVVAAAALTPFVGREAERAELRRLLDRALDGHSCVALVAGEPGVGKTRLLQELHVEAESRGMHVLVGHCAEPAGAQAYLPFVEVLEQALLSPRSPAALRAALGDLAGEIGRIVPGVRRERGDVPDPVELPPDQARRYLWNSVLAYLDRAARDRPLLLDLEDLHWADESTLALLAHLAPQLATLPVFVVGTYRDTEVGPEHPLAATIDHLRRRHLLTLVTLRRLTQHRVGEMLQGLAHQAPPAGLAATVHAETDGNPFFVEEVYLHLAESGALLDERGRFRPSLRIDELDVPESLRLVIGGRLARLGPATRDALAAAAIVGRTFDSAVVARVAEQSPEALAQALDVAERARLVVPTHANADLMFNHELIRQTLLTDTSTVRRRLLHARAATAIEQLAGDDLADHAADILAHLDRAGPHASPEAMARFARLAGDRAMEVTAFDDAVAHFTRAAALGAAGDPARAELLERLAMAQRSAGRWDEALGTLDQALDHYERLGRRDDIGRVCWTMVYHLAWGARFEEAFAVASRGLAVLGDAHTADRARLMSVLGWVTSLAGDYHGAVGLFGPARAIAEDIGDKRALADVLHMQTMHNFGYARFAAGVEDGLAAADVFEAEGALWDLCSALGFTLYQAGAVGRPELAAELAERVAPLAAKLGHLGATFLTLSHRVRAEGVLRADFEVIARLAPEQIEVCERGGLPWLYVGYLYLGFVAGWQGEWDEAERQLAHAASVEPPGTFSGQSAAHLAVHLARAGRVAEVGALADELRAALPQAGRVNSLGSWNALLLLTEALYESGRHAEAASLAGLVDEMLALADDEWLLFDGRLVQTIGAMAVAAANDWDEAERRYDAAAATAAAMGHRIEQAEILRLRARMLVDRGAAGDRERARALLDDAADRYEALGMAAHAGRARGVRAAEPAPR